MTGAELAFTGFGLASQALLLGYFGARRWRPRLAERYGWMAYAFCALGLPLGLWLLVDGQPWTLAPGPILLGLWAVYGAYLDLVRPRPWRRGPVAWRVVVPFAALYISAQMFLWWPLWNVERAAWIVFLVLFVPNTVLNLQSHVEKRAGA